MNPAQLINPHLAKGTLINLGPPLRTPLYWQFNRLTARATAPLTRALQQAAQSLTAESLIAKATPC